MRLETNMIIPLTGKDQNGNKVPPHPDSVILQKLVEGEPEKPEEQEAIEDFEKEIRKYQGYLAINENFETTYIPPYDDIAAVIRHKFKGNEFIIVDLSKVGSMAFLSGLRVSDDNEEIKE